MTQLSRVINSGKRTGILTLPEVQYRFIVLNVTTEWMVIIFHFMETKYWNLGTGIS